MEVEQQCEPISAPAILNALFSDFSTIADYHILRDSLPCRLANLLKCRCVLLYTRIGETLQLAAGSFDDTPGWSASLLRVAHINPVDVNVDTVETRAWRERHVVGVPAAEPTLVACPLIYRQRCIGVMVVVRRVEEGETVHGPPYWLREDMVLLEAIAGVVALLLENTRLLEQDRERIQELSLLNSISSQMNCSLYEFEHLRTIVLQRTREIAGVDCCALLEPAGPADAASWITPRLHALLFKHCHEQGSLAPIVIERPDLSDEHSVDGYLQQLPVNIKTFFAIPLVSGRTMSKPGSSLLRGRLATQEGAKGPQVPGIIVGGYYQPWKLRQAEMALLQTLASQASAVLENMRLVQEVMEARNEARKLLRQVLDDQRLKELILESIPSGLITTDLHGSITTFNRAAEAMLGYHSREVVGLLLHTLFTQRSTISTVPFSTPAALPFQMQDVIASVVRTGEAQQSTVKLLDRYDRQLVLEIDVQPLYDDLGARIGTLTTFSDMTSIHYLEEEKRRLDRLASLGEMAANVAHEVRNPLASIKTSMQLVRDDLVKDEPYAPEQREWELASVDVVLKEVERLDRIVRDLLLFARPRQLHRSYCNFTQLSDHVLTLIQGQYAAAGIVVQRIYEAVPPIRVDMGQMEQVLLNLYINAVQAMADGGVLTISCRCISAEQTPGEQHGRENVVAQRPVHVRSALQKPGRSAVSQVRQWLEIVVSDTGEGIAPDQLERIFHPFYTTKAHGIGLGLAITRRLVEDHGGYMCVESQPGYGAAIAVRLPFTAGERLQEHH